MSGNALFLRPKTTGNMKTLTFYTGGRCSGQFFSASSLFPSKSFKQGAKNISPVAALFTVRTATIIQSSVTATEKIVPRTLKKVDGNSFAICVVLVVNTPSGKVNPHHPMLNGNLLLVILAAAKNSHTSPNPHMIVATNHPSTYRISAELVEEACNVPVFSNV